MHQYRTRPAACAMVLLCLIVAAVQAQVNISGRLEHVVPADASAVILAGDLPDTINALHTNPLVASLYALSNPDQPRQSSSERQTAVLADFAGIPSDTLLASLCHDLAIVVQVVDQQRTQTACIGQVVDEQVFDQLLIRLRAVVGEYQGTDSCYEVQQPPGVIARVGKWMICARKPHETFEKLIRLADRSMGFSLAYDPAYATYAAQVGPGADVMIYVHPREFLDGRDTGRAHTPHIPHQTLLSRYLAGMDSVVIGMWITSSHLEARVRGTSDMTLRDYGLANASPPHALQVLPGDTSAAVWVRRDMKSVWNLLNDTDTAVSQQVRQRMQLLRQVVIAMSDGDADDGRQLLSRMGPDMVMAVGNVPGASVRPARQFIIPAVAIIIEADASAASQMLEAISRAADMGRLALSMMPPGKMASDTTTPPTTTAPAPPADLAQQVQWHMTVPIYYLPVGKVLEQYTDCPYLHTLEIAWAHVADKYMVLSSSRAYIQAMIDAATDRTPRWGDTTLFKQALPEASVSGPPLHAAMLISGTNLSKMMGSWLDASRAYGNGVLPDIAPVQAVQSFQQVTSQLEYASSVSHFDEATGQFNLRLTISTRPNDRK